VFAVATIDNVIIYTSQSVHPIAVIKNLHYDSINDLAWVKNKMLTVASSDGYCSFIAMDKDLIGEILPHDSESMPALFEEHYKNLEEVFFERKVEEASRNK
jgi:chromatin assembly factor 1 subunit B